MLCHSIKVSLDPLPSEKQMVLCAHCNSLAQSYQANLVALKYHPTAVELMDGKILELCRNNPTQERNRFFVHGEPAALIIAEFNGEDMDQQANSMEQELIDKGLAYHCSRVYGNDINRVWALRKAGLGVLTGTRSDRKPIGVIEDTAVAPERLPEYLDDFAQMSNASVSNVYTMATTAPENYICVPFSTSSSLPTVDSSDKWPKKPRCWYADTAEA